MSIDILPEQLNELKYKIRIDDKNRIEGIIISQRQIAEVQINGANYEGLTVPLVIESNLLWNTYEMTGNGINRSRGIAIESIVYE